MTMKHHSFGYELLRLYVRFAFWLSHKQITVSGKENIPKGKPIIFAPNHQNALMDPLALVCTNNLQTVWLARADIFKSKTTRSILNFLKVWPVYRIRDGKENLANNEEIFAKVNQLLEEKQSVALFPEAAHSGRRQMLPHKKAIPRITLEAEAQNNFSLELQIIPVGISYSHYWNFNRSLLVQYGEPITIENFWFDYEMNPQKAMMDLRDLIREKLEALVIEINSSNYYEEYELVRQLAGKSLVKPKFFSKKKALQQFRAEKELIDKLEILEKESPKHFEELINQLHHYQQSLNDAKCTDNKVENAQKSGKIVIPFKILLALLSLPIFAYGFLTNALPFYVPRAWIGRKVKDKIFTSSFNYVLGLIIFPSYYLTIYFVLFHPRYATAVSLLLIALMPFMGKAAYLLLQFYQNLFHQSKYLFCTKTYRKKMDKLIEMRWILVEMIRDKINF
jgi:1-acyl-sn-glycerol-3-phosphate acyltransferase